MKTAWKFVKEHAVSFSPPGTQEFHGHFALCEECWNETDEDERVRYHMAAFNQYSNQWNDEIECAEILRQVRLTSRNKEEAV